MSRKMRVWGGLWQGQRPGLRVIVRAPTKKAAVVALDRAGHHISLYEFNIYWSETGNTEELGVMANRPDGAVLARPMDPPHHKTEFLPYADAETKWWGRDRP